MRPSLQNNYFVAIKTACGNFFGMGHIQRMTSLLWYLNERKKLNTFLITDAIPDSFPPEFLKYVDSDNTNLRYNLIIRDMRDSSEGEIALLKKIGKVLVIDDNGTGKPLADYAVDILPNPDVSNRGQHCNAFLYGFNFIKALSVTEEKKVKKDLDFLIYPGNSATSEYINFLISLLPPESDFAVFNGRNSCLVKGNKKFSIEESLYANKILSAKVVISHFGISLYEGYASKCRVIALNPGAYHSVLADMARDDLCLINLGEYKKIDKTKASKIIEDAVRTPLCKSVNTGDVYKAVIDNLEEFSRFIIGLL